MLIASILFVIPSLPTLIPTVNADVEQPPTLWRPYGPYVKEVLASVFSNEVSELAAYDSGQLDWFDWTLAPAQITPHANNPDDRVSQSVPEAGIFEVDINSRVALLGVAQQEPAGPCSTVSTDPQFEGLFGTCSSLRQTEAGRQVRKALAHLIDKATFVADTPLCQGGRCVAVDDQIPAAVCLEGETAATEPTVEPCSTLAQRNAWESAALSLPHFSTAACPADIVGTAQTPCAYHEAAGPGLGAPSVADKIAACEHLLAAGLTLNNGASGSAALASCATVADSDSLGLEFSFPSNGQLVFAIRSDDARRTQLGTAMADALDSLFEKPGGTPVVFRQFGNIAALGATVFLSSPDTDYGLYTGGWGLGLDATHIFPLYDSEFASDFCGGTPSLFNLNYGFYCSNAFDIQTEQGTFGALSLGAFNAPHREASNIAGNDVMTIPAYSRASRTLVADSWDGSVHVKGDGYANTFNWFNMRQNPSFVSTGGRGLPNPGPDGIRGTADDILRVGFRQGTSKLNIFHAGTVWESYIIFNILDSPAGANPRALTNPFFEPYETHLLSVTEEFNTKGADQIEGNADDELVTVLNLVFRGDITFHDGVQETAEDFLRTGLALRDVPQGGFGGAAIWAPLLSSSLPIPGSNCGNLCVQLVLTGQSFLHKFNIILGTPILPLHLWDAGADGTPNTGDAGEGDGFICSALAIGSCAGLPADGTTDINYDPMANKIMVGSNAFMCLGPGPDGVRGTSDDNVGGSCSETAAGVLGGQSITTNGRFLLTRYDAYPYSSPQITGTKLHNLAIADVDNDWQVDVVDFVLASGDLALQALIQVQIDFKLGGTPGQTFNDVDTSNTGNAYAIGP